jgi:hypothetical protein
VAKRVATPFLRVTGNQFHRGDPPLILIKNISNEAIEIVHLIDPQVRGCRIKPIPLSSVLEPGCEEQHMGYEPGVSLIVRPVKDPHLPRSGLNG